MKRKIFLVCILTILILTMGCTLQGPESNPSFSVLPEVLLDYDFDTEETKIWVKSAISDFRYDNITIKLSTTNKTEMVLDNNTYGASIYTKHKLFYLEILVVSEEKMFRFYGKVDVDINREDLIIITTYDEITDEPTEEAFLEDDLPYREILEEIKKEG
ncbi:hypothetical protein [[Eubacterium] cellulosolvens]